MDGFVDLQEAVDAEIKHRMDKIMLILVHTNT